MDLLSNILIITLAGLIHASLQLSPGCLILLYRRTLSTPKLRRTSHKLSLFFILGVATITILLVASICYLLFILFNNQFPLIFTAISSGVAIGLAAIIPFIYYRKKGTTLWIPRSAADFLTSRATCTSNAPESFSLGIMSVLCEAPLTLILITIASASILEFTTTWQLLMIALYTLLVASPLIITNLSLRLGSNISRIQRWRESNKFFFRFLLFAGFLVLGAYIFVFKGVVAI